MRLKGVIVLIMMLSIVTFTLLISILSICGMLTVFINTFGIPVLFLICVVGATVGTMIFKKYYYLFD